MAAYSWHSLASPAPLNTPPCEALAVNLRQPLRRDNIRLPLNFRSPSIPPFPDPDIGLLRHVWWKTSTFALGFPVDNRSNSTPRPFSRTNVRAGKRLRNSGNGFISARFSSINNEGAKRSRMTMTILTRRKHGIPLDDIPA